MAFDLDIPKDWEEEWKGMPEFVRLDNNPFQRIVVNFRTREDVQAFAKLVGRKITNRTDSIWFPPYKTRTGVFIDKDQEKIEEEEL